MTNQDGPDGGIDCGGRGGSGHFEVDDHILEPGGIVQFQPA